MFLESDGVHRFKGKFIAICSFTMSCICTLTPAGASPYCHLGDGTTDLMLVQECSRYKFLKHLMRVADKTADQVTLSERQMVFLLKEVDLG